jgi:5-enolpyruvylshikimate-3-phosphate synthase
MSGLHTRIKETDRIEAMKVEGTAFASEITTTKTL